ncbi:MAG TPA: histidine kinase, partial [Cyanobacteria bacterium UBA8803]|nr:histidine kinase [Cyanobacteria bacterium UBA9273]HBL61056.1 histidine kinase [Cyanobacteria bacterium UBA8803]
MDMRMPVMDGYQATREIKARERPTGEEDFRNGEVGQQIPHFPTVIIALTASAFEEQQTTILSAGCDDFIGKPFREKILLEKIADHLGVRYLYQDSCQPISPQYRGTVEAVTRETLAVMPKEWRVQLHRAARACNDEEIVRLIEQIPESQAAVKLALADLVDNFRLDIIFDLTQASPNE